MVPNLRRKLLAIGLLAAWAIYALLFDPINLGLDLQGGSRLVYRFDFKEAVEEGVVSEQEAQNPQELLAQTAQVFLRRLDATGLADIPIYAQGEDRIVVEIPKRSESEVEAIKRIILSEGSLLFRIMVDDSDDLGREAEIEKFRKWRAEHPDTPITDFNRVPEKEGGPRKGVAWYGISPTADAQESLKAAPDVDAVMVRVESELRGQAPDEAGSWDFSGADLQYVGPGVDAKSGFPAVQFELAEHRKSAFGDFTEEFKGRYMAIILNGQVHSAPVIQNRLPGGGIITGGLDGFSPEEVKELVTVLRTGSLKIKPELESESFVGPSLGQDSIRTGVWSAIVGGALVLAFMIVYYRTNGIVASLALLYNGLLLLGALTFSHATLTLPGLAGLVLTIGMAVDANILIFERVREERNRGREVPQAYKNGYERAFTTIVDANLTTLITALILSWVGTGPVRGFAVVLSLGILTTLFASLIFSKVLMHFLVFGKKPIIREVSMVGRLAGQRRFPFLRWSRFAVVGSSLCIVAGLVVFTGNLHMLMGIDFTGGGLARVHLQEAADIGTLRDRLPGYTVTRIAGGEEARADMSRVFLVKKKFTGVEGETMVGFEQELASRLQDLLDPEDPFPEISTVGQRVSGDIQQKAVQAILLSLIAIVIYMNFRFKEVRYGLAAVIAVFHDVLFTLGAIAVMDVLGLVQVEINLEIIAAFLTIIGYSLNDTIVVFDRIRENLPRRKEGFQDVIEISITQSLSRTILTSLTTFFVVAMLFFSNRPLHNVLEGFAFAMLVGVVVGTYSSIFIASPLLVFLDRWARKQHLVPAGGKAKGKATPSPA